MHKVTEKTYKPAGRKLPQHVDKLCDKYCEDCRFYSPHTKTCDHLLVTDKCRGCDPGKGCKAKEPLIKQNGKRIKWDTVKARELYDQGKRDTEIAQEVGVTPSTVAWWRHRHDLPTKYPHRPINRNWDKVEARRLYNMGLRDKDIADAVDVKVDAICKWRKKEGLPKHG